jgi:dienelactone hydrolase
MKKYGNIIGVKPEKLDEYKRPHAAVEPIMKNSMLSVIVLAGLMGASRLRGEGDSLPPLVDGKIPTNVDELWGNYDPSKEPLDVQVVRDWQQGDITIRHVVFTIGTFKGQKSRLAGFYAFPKSDKKLPAILQIHGGGGKAEVSAAIWAADNGCAGLSINWLGNPMDKMQEGDANTDWGAIDATQKHNDHYDGTGAAKADPKTLDAVESPRNNNWFLLVLAARRSLTFLEQQPEVDPTRLGVTGHSMGGKITVNVAGIDKRVKAAVPSCGGSGGIAGKLTDLPESVVKPRNIDMMTATILDEAYIPRVTCPILFLSASNDHAGPFDAMAENWKKIGSKNVRYTLVPHFTHRSLPESEVCRTLWFDQHLKGAFAFPKTPELTVNLKTANGVPQVTVKTDRPDEVVKVDIYYSLDPNYVMRFWRDAEAKKNGDVWVGNAPILSTAQPLIVYANVFYQLKKDTVMERRVQTPSSFMITSKQAVYHPDELVAAGVKATDKVSRQIDDFSRGWHDWFRLSWGNPHHWVASTRKLHDLKWRGPEGAALVFEVMCPKDNMLAIEAKMNVWGTFPGKPSGDYSTRKALKGSPEWQTVSIKLEEMLKKDSPAPMPSWETVTELNLTRPATCLVDGKEVEFGKGWDAPIELRNMRWEGGVDRADVTVPKNLDGTIQKETKKSMESGKQDK